MEYNQMLDALENAERTERSFRMMINRFANIISKRMRNLNHGHLVKMKKELQNYNIKTGEWKK